MTESYVGAIALGWLLAEGIMQFVNGLVAPLVESVNRAEFPKATEITGAWVQFESTLPGLVRFLLILVIWYALFHWLYVRPSNANAS